MHLDAMKLIIVILTVIFTTESARIHNNKQILTKLAGADLADEEDAPYHVVIGARRRFVGSGTLIRPDWVLTVR